MTRTDSRRDSNRIDSSGDATRSAGASESRRRPLRHVGRTLNRACVIERFESSRVQRSGTFGGIPGIPKSARGRKGRACTEPTIGAWSLAAHARGQSTAACCTRHCRRHPARTARRGAPPVHRKRPDPQGCASRCRPARRARAPARAARPPAVARSCPRFRSFLPLLALRPERRASDREGRQLPERQSARRLRLLGRPPGTADRRASRPARDTSAGAPRRARASSARLRASASAP